MLAALVSVPLLALLVMLQSVVVSRVPLLSGTADIILLTLAAWALHERVHSAWVWALVGGAIVSYISALPPLTPLAGYLIVTGLGRLLRHRIWQTPILSMLLTTLLGTLAMHALSFFLLDLQGSSLPLGTVLNTITLPSVLLNLVLALPVYALITDLANTLHPLEVNL